MGSGTEGFNAYGGSLQSGVLSSILIHFDSLSRWLWEVRTVNPLIGEMLGRLFWVCYSWNDLQCISVVDGSWTSDMCLLTVLTLQAWDDDWWEPFDDDKYPSLKKDPGAIYAHMTHDHA